MQKKFTYCTNSNPIFVNDPGTIAMVGTAATPASRTVKGYSIRFAQV